MTGFNIIMYCNHGFNEFKDLERGIELTEIIAEVERLRGSPRRVIGGGSVGGGVEKPAGGAANCVIFVTGCGGGGGDGCE